jgi:hypothetical protein
MRRKKLVAFVSLFSVAILIMLFLIRIRHYTLKENEALAPIGKTMHYGNVNGIKVFMPKKYWASGEFNPKEVSPYCRRDIAIEDQYKCSISSIRLSLRQSTYDPISTHADLMDWWSNFMLPHDKTKPGHRWIETYIDADLFSSIQGNLEGFYTNHLERASNKFGALDCDIKFGLSHCVTSKEDGPLSPNEFFFDKNTGLTLIECTKLTSQYGVYYWCTQYFSIPEMRVIVHAHASSVEETSQWELLNNATKTIALTFIQTN